MEKSSQRGQIMIEAALVAVLMVGFFLLAVSLAETGNEAQKTHRFSSWSKR